MLFLTTRFARPILWNPDAIRVCFCGRFLLLHFRWQFNSYTNKPFSCIALCQSMPLKSALQADSFPFVGFQNYFGFRPNLDHSSIQFCRFRPLTLFCFWSYSECFSFSYFHQGQFPHCSVQQTVSVLHQTAPD